MTPTVKVIEILFPEMILTWDRSDIRVTYVFIQPAGRKPFEFFIFSVQCKIAVSSGMNRQEVSTKNIQRGEMKSSSIFSSLSARKY